jgi:hypothetical protein
MLLRSDELFVATGRPSIPAREGSTVNLDHRPARIAATIWHSLSTIRDTIERDHFGEP